MEIIKVVSFVFVALFFYIILKESKSAVAFGLVLAAGIAVFIFMVPQLQEIIIFVRDMATKAGVDIVYIEIIMKIIGISYIASFCIELCKDSGSGILASKVEFAAKILILVLAIPILAAVLNSILKIM
ncbi:stage III sporulation protein AD [uncultured Clostridium sp.]|jgi:stage III sporulation protein AD|uniref:stage III sporulation protein AD n=1 Tax=uncultured Clostridium sp. TaxID=59620 RepID=UPI00262E0BBD|nr:stage III sporulation protein AD [uncultured Clostridium sp.]